MNFDRAVILHGKPKPERYDDPNFDPSRANWLGWMADMLPAEGVEKVISLCVPQAENPVWSKWEGSLDGVRTFMETPLAQSTKGCVLLGHSAAAIGYLRWLGTNLDIARDQIGAMVLVAPWLDLERKHREFSSFRIDRRIQEVVGKAIVISSSDDLGGVPESVVAIKQGLPETKLIKWEGFGHFMTGNKLEEDYPLGGERIGSSFEPLVEVLRSI